MPKAGYAIQANPDNSWDTRALFTQEEFVGQSHPIETVVAEKKISDENNESENNRLRRESENVEIQNTETGDPRLEHTFIEHSLST